MSDDDTPPMRRSIPHGKDLVEFRLDSIDESQARVESKVDRLLSSSTSHGERLASLDQRMTRCETDISHAFWWVLGAAIAAIGSLITLLFNHH